MTTVQTKTRATCPRCRQDFYREERVALVESLVEQARLILASGGLDAPDQAEEKLADVAEHIGRLN